MLRERVAFSFRNADELLERLGRIPLWRVCFVPPPGTATKRHLIRTNGSRGGTCELVDGVIVEKPRDHVKAVVAADLAYHLGQFINRHDLGLGFCVGAWVEVMPGVVRTPDISFVSWNQLPERVVPQVQISRQAPDLAVEFVCPDNTPAEMQIKLNEYFIGGVQMVWIIDPRAWTAESYVAPDRKTIVSATGALDGGDVLPGFRLPLAKLFEKFLAAAAKKSKRKKKK